MTGIAYHNVDMSDARDFTYTHTEPLAQPSPPVTGYVIQMTASGVVTTTTDGLTDAAPSTGDRS